MATKNEVMVKVVGGASREELRDSVGSRANSRLWVHFVVALTEELQIFLGAVYRETRSIQIIARIDKFEWEDGSGESFNLGGLAKLPMFTSSGRNIVQFHAHYDTRVRQGTITLKTT